MSLPHMIAVWSSVLVVVDVWSVKNDLFDVEELPDMYGSLNHMSRDDASSCATHEHARYSRLWRRLLSIRSSQLRLTLKRIQIISSNRIHHIMPIIDPQR